MKYRLKSLSIWEQGHYRGNQEDNIYPKMGEMKDDDRMFVLCDGMGGHDKGEVASRIVCDAFADYADRNFSPEGDFEDQMLVDATNHALDQLDANDEGLAKKMGTTLAFLKLHVGGATIGHIGDSRVYHIRPGKGVEDTQILLCTRDHSLVADLVRVGEITEEEARNHPQKNVITRSMMPHQDHRPKVEIDHVSDIWSGDYFFMCSDGMLDQMDDENLKFIFSKPDASDEEKVEMLKGSSDDSHDNHSAHIIHILEVFDETAERKESILTQETELTQNLEPTKGGKGKNSSTKHWLWLFLLLAVLALLGGAFVAWYFDSNKETPASPKMQNSVKAKGPNHKVKKIDSVASETAETQTDEEERSADPRN